MDFATSWFHFVKFRNHSKSGPPKTDYFVSYLFSSHYLMHIACVLLVGLERCSILLGGRHYLSLLPLSTLNISAQLYFCSFYRCKLPAWYQHCSKFHGAWVRVNMPSLSLFNLWNFLLRFSSRNCNGSTRIRMIRKYIMKLATSRNWICCLI